MFHVKRAKFHNKRLPENKSICFQVAWFTIRKKIMQQLRNIQSHSFASDNYSGVLSEIMVAIQTANGGHVGAYGNDPYTEKLQ